MATHQLVFSDDFKERDESTVNGYFRRIEKTIFCNHPFYKFIPKSIKYVCIKFYHHPRDKFHPELHGLNIKITGDIATKTTPSFPESAFLCKVVSSGSHQWRFKINAYNGTGVEAMYFGIWSIKNDEKNVLQGFSYDKVNAGAMGLKVNCGELRGRSDPKIRHYNPHYSQGCKTGDIIDMFLDFKNKELAYSINDKRYGKAFDIKNESYRAQVLIQSADEIQLISYDVKHPT